MIKQARQAKPGFYVTHKDGQESWVPESRGNQSYHELMEWVAQGNEIQPYVAPPETSITVIPWQFRKALNQLGLRQQVEDAVAASTDYEVKDGWEYATEFREDDPLVQSMAQAIGVTEIELHNLFELARTL